MIKILTAFALIFFSETIYTFNIPLADGGQIELSHFQGKKILLVNVATGSPLETQLAGLEQLQQAFPDSLVIIAIPSNSFGNETRPAGEILKYVSDKYGLHYRLSSFLDVKGNNQSPLYRWLTRVDENGSIEGEIKGDFQKYLINEEGIVTGVFAPSVEPLDTQIKEAIRQQP